MPLPTARPHQFSRRINANKLDEAMYTSPKALRGWDLPDPDILVRTSGVCRMSDFLLWQVRSSVTSPFIVPTDEFLIPLLEG